MSLKYKLLASYFSQIYVTIIGIVMVPVYVRYMGVEAYGLVGFFATLQALFQLLDVGLTPTMARETARFTGGATDAQNLRRLLRAMEGVFVIVAVLGGAGVWAGADIITYNWLKVQQLPMAEVQNAIKLIAVVIALRWVCGLYRSIISGFENLIWLSGFNIIIATARFALVIPFFIFVGTSPSQFFCYQLAIAVIELALMIIQTYRLMPKVPLGADMQWKWEPLHEVLAFSLKVAFTGSVWVVVTQTDKLILSSLLTLSDYAYFSLAVLVASGVGIISGPISNAILPRMSKLVAEGNNSNLINLYRGTTRLIGVIAIPVALLLAYFSEQVLWTWTGNATIAHKAAPVLSLYALGNGLLTLSAFPYYLQFSKGDLKLHVIGSICFAGILVPALIVSTLQYGAIGAGWAWLGANVIYFLFWVPLVHRRHAKGLHQIWILHDIGPIILPTVIGASLMQGYVNWSGERTEVVLKIASIGIALLLVALTGAAVTRKMPHSK